MTSFQYIFSSFDTQNCDETDHSTTIENIEISSKTISDPSLSKKYSSTERSTIYEIMNKSSNRNETDTFSKYPDIEIIRRDENAIDKSIPHDIPADIELIPMSSDEVSNKRAIKRSFSPDNTISKISKLNDYSSATTVTPSSPNSSLKHTTTAVATLATTTASSSQQQTIHLDSATIAHSNSIKCEYSIENTSSPVNNIITMSYNTKLNPPISISSANASGDTDTILIPSTSSSSSISIHSMDTNKLITSRFTETEPNDRIKHSPQEVMEGLDDEVTINSMHEFKEDEAFIEETTIDDQQYQLDEHQQQQQQQHYLHHQQTDSSDYSNEQIQNTILLDQHQQNSNSLVTVTSQSGILSEKAIIKSEPSIDIMDSVEPTTSMSSLDNFANNNDYNCNAIVQNNVNFCTMNDDNSGNCNDQITINHNTHDQETDNIYKNFQGVLQIQPN